jgi:hypothetical protein
MKVCFLGNMNNVGFVLMRYLNYNGINTDLLLTEPGSKHFMPEADSFKDEWKSNIKYIGWNERNYYNVSKKEIQEVLKPYDFIIGTDYSPMYCAKGGRQMDLFIPQGADIFYTPFIKFPLFPKTKWEIYQWMVSKKQRKAIEDVRYISFAYTNDINESLINQLDLKGKRYNLPSPILYMPQYEGNDFLKFRNDNFFYKRIESLKNKYDLVIFHHSSHQWKNPFYNLSYKGNEKIISGFAETIKNYEGKKMALVMFEYGPDVMHSKELIKQLGIEEHVYWFETMFRKDIVTGLSIVDLGVGEVGHSWLIYGVVAEFFAFSRPVMHHRKDELYNTQYKDLYPMYSACKKEEVIHHLQALINSPDQFKETGISAKEWYMRYFVDEPIAVYKSLIKS